MNAEKATPHTLTGTLVDPVQKTSFGARLTLSEQGTIAAIEHEPDPDPGYILPGFVDAHVHIESSMLTPAAFARAAVTHGTLAAVADPHEIANVLGERGVMLMLELASKHRSSSASVSLPVCRPLPSKVLARNWDRRPSRACSICLASRTSPK